jgi:small subunit ribosomal protein S19e
MEKSEKMNITPYEIKSEKFIKALAAKLKTIDEFKMPKWALFVKTSQAKERPPENKEWWYIRIASILRKLYMKGLAGVGKFRTYYGSRKDRGARPEKFKRASGKIIRTILQQATKAQLVEHIKEKKAGRRLTKKGKIFLDQIASELKQEQLEK